MLTHRKGRRSGPSRGCAGASTSAQLEPALRHPHASNRSAQAIVSWARCWPAAEKFHISTKAHIFYPLSPTLPLDQKTKARACAHRDDRMRVSQRLFQRENVQSGAQRGGKRAHCITRKRTAVKVESAQLRVVRSQYAHPVGGQLAATLHFQLL